MEPTTIDEKQERMKNFLSRLSELQAEKETEIQVKEAPMYKLNVLDDEKEKALENCAAGVICKIYRDAIPLDDDYKAANKQELNNGFINTIREGSPDGVYCYLSSCADAGSRPAQLMLEAVREQVDQVFAKFYEDIDELDVDEIDMGPGSKDIEDSIEKVTADMDYDQISDVIEQNVQNTVRNEIESQKAEDEKLKQLEDSLATDDNVQTESAIEQALMANGFREEIYQPSLFTGIMIGKVKEFTESTDLDDEHVQKKAFFESVKEYTKHETLSVLSMGNYTQSSIDALANRYATGNM